jgi:large subunit ribosomal protein L19
MSFGGPRDLPKLSVGDLVRVVFYLEPPAIRRPADGILSHIAEKWTERDLAGYHIDLTGNEEGADYPLRIGWDRTWPDLIFEGGGSGTRSNPRAHLSETRGGALLKVPFKRTRREKGKKKVRTQAFEGTVISVRSVEGGRDNMYTVRKTFKRTSAEKVFFLSSPLVRSFEVLREFKVSRAKLYYLRGRTGKAARLRPLRPGGRRGRS